MKKATVLFIILLLGVIQIFLTTQPLPASPYQELSEGNLAYAKHGTGEKNLILLHGSPGSKHDFDDLLPRFDPEEYTVYAIDMYGFGESTKHVNDYGIESASVALKEFTDKQGLDTVSILGYSWGSGVAISFAHKYPEKTSQVFLLGGMGIQEGEPTGNYYLEHSRYLFSYPFVVYYPGGFAGSIGWRKGFMRSFMDSDQRTVENMLKEMQAPLTVIHGDKDEVVPMWVAEKHAELAKNGHVDIYSGGHGQVFFDTTQIHQIIVEHL